MSLCPVDYWCPFLLIRWLLELLLPGIRRECCAHILLALEQIQALSSKDRACDVCLLLHHQRSKPHPWCYSVLRTGQSSVQSICPVTSMHLLLIQRSGRSKICWKGWRKSSVFEACFIMKPRLCSDLQPFVLWPQPPGDWDYRHEPP